MARWHVCWQNLISASLAQFSAVRGSLFMSYVENVDFPTRLLNFNDDGSSCPCEIQTGNLEQDDKD